MESENMPLPTSIRAPEIGSPVEPTLNKGELHLECQAAFRLIGDEFNAGRLDLEKIEDENLKLSTALQVQRLVANTQLDKEIEGAVCNPGGEYTLVVSKLDETQQTRLGLKDEQVLEAVTLEDEKAHAKPQEAKIAIDSLQTVITHPDASPEAKAAAQAQLKILEQHTEVATEVVSKDGRRIEKKITFKEWEEGETKDGEKIPEDAKASFQLVGREEAPEKTEEVAEKAEEKSPEDELAERKRIWERIKVINEKIKRKVKTAVEQVRTQGKDPKDFPTIFNVYALALQNPSENASLAFLNLSLASKEAVLREDPTAPVRLKNSFSEAMAEMSSLTPEQVGVIGKLNFEQATEFISASTNEAMFNSLISSVPGLKDLEEALGEDFRTEFCQKLFGKVITQRDLEASLARFNIKGWGEKLGGHLDTGLLLFMLYSCFMQNMEALEANMFGGGQGGAAQ